MSILAATLRIADGAETPVRAKRVTAASAAVVVECVG